VIGQPAAVIGYLGLDHSVQLRQPLQLGRTTLVARRNTPPTGRLGGCAAHISLGLAAVGVSVSVIGWLGPDVDGDRIAGELEQAGVETTGLARTLSRTPCSWLVYAPDGTCTCIYDPGGPLSERLSTPQRQRLTSRRVVVSVGPPGPVQEALDLIPPDAQLAWSVKADPESVPSDLARRLAARASAIVWSRDEAPFLDEALGPGWVETISGRGTLCVETRGADGVEWRQGAGRGWLRGTVLAVTDPTGAGDRFTAGLMAGIWQGLGPEPALRAGMEAATTFLRGRQPEGRDR
jgi:ribokinase